MARKYIMAGNWKMYKTIAEAKEFISQIIPLVEKSSHKVYLAVPFTAIQSAVKKAEGSSVVIGAQNMNDASEGAFTGEIAAQMLKDAGAQFVILGHSERRAIFGEDDGYINKKVKKALSDGLQPILCIGETLEQREAGETNDVLKKQLQGSLEGVDAAAMSNIVVAYEPVWAIGTGKTATPEMAQEAHAYIRGCIAKMWDAKVAKALIIQYGGSVKPANVKELMSQDDIDGALVGGAALDQESFAAIVNF